MRTDMLTDVAVRSLQAMADGIPGGFADLVHPAATNREALDEPMDCRACGPQGFDATARWLHEAWNDLEFTVDTAVAADDLVVTYGAMAGRHTGPFTVYGTDARVSQVFPATGRSFRVQHVHFFRMLQGLIVEHWAVRDDRALGEQLGWAPPTLAYAARMQLATRRARRMTPPPRRRGRRKVLWA